MDGGLEVDKRTNLPIPCKVPSEGDNYINEITQDHLNTPQEHLIAPQQPPQGKHFCGLRPTTLLLSIAFASTLVLAAVAAGVAGSLAAKRDTR